ncbi:hypothetical protein OK016_04840 [Vibrio chagasii]|nr:hypothetical protein [Vibrio chagasii]
MTSVLLLLTLVLLITTASLGYMLWHSSNHASEVEREQRLIPKVELLLNHASIRSVTMQRHCYRKMVKALLLQQQIEYAYTDLASKMPIALQEPIDGFSFLPGAKNMRAESRAI